VSILVPILEISNEKYVTNVTCSFYGKAAILLAKHFSDRDLRPISNSVDTRLKRGESFDGAKLQILISSSFFRTILFRASARVNYFFKKNTLNPAWKSRAVKLPSATARL